jgi:hypothetical protein
MDKDTRHKAIWDFQQAVIDIYKEKELKSLAGPNREFDVNGRQIIQWYFNIVRKGRLKFKDFNFHECFDDLIFCSDEVLYFTGLLYLYAPYMNNPINDGYWFVDRMMYPNFQNLEAKRFSMISNSVSEKVYNYWDRIGDLIATYFPDLIDPKRVFFPTAIDIIPTKYHSSDNYKWLKEFRDGEYKRINEKRKEVVHYLTHDTDFRHRHLESTSNKEEMEKLIKERDGLPDFFKGQIKYTLDGFEKTILLIEEITTEDLKDVK